MGYILGIHDGHTSTAALLKGSEIIGAISEERITRKKSQSGFPINAIKSLLIYNKIDPSEIDQVAVGSLVTPVTQDDMIRTNYYKLERAIFSKTSNIIPYKMKNSPITLEIYRKIFGKQKKRIKYIKEQLSKLGITNDFEIIEHHFAHACAALYKNQQNFKKCLIITNDGSGDGLSGTINIYNEGNLERLKEISSYNSIGEFYTRITQYLGMKPLEHEFKVMGLAPYPMETEFYLNVKKQFFQFFNTDGLNIINKTGCWGNSYFSFFKKYVYPTRFDYVAKATQYLLENVIVKWIKNTIEKTGINNLCLAGGVFMNVKLNMKIRNLEEVEKLFVFPSGGDESIAIGAALALNSNNNKDRFSPLKDIYFGHHYNNDDIENELNNDQYRGKIKFEYVDNIEDKFIEELLNKNIVARFSGRSEWGARALGNRSILALANDPNLLHKINKAIKKRDFWMPFAPSILFDDKDKYIIDNDKLVSHYMNMAYETKEKAKEDIIAAIHPFDFTARPQLVVKDFNENYYNIISRLNDEIGVGGILNTSFNLHGEPIVNTPKDALHTLLNSDIDYLVMENYLVNTKI